MAAEGGEPRLILASHAPEGEHVRTGDLSWSPGGSTIRFTRDQKMWEVSSSGSNPHQLLPGWHASASQWGGQWTLDGEFFLFVSGSIGSMNRFPNYNHGGQLWAIDERRGVEGHISDLASMQAVTRVNAEQASKDAMRKPTRHNFGEGCHCKGSERKTHLAVPPG
jgi:hypothetical protein